MPITTPAMPDLLALIQRTWGFRILKPLQQPAMQAFLDRRDSLTVLPTGGGKSLCYQAPAVLLSQAGFGPTVVVSPLIALMKDQVDSLRQLGIAASQLDSSLSADDRRAVANDLRTGRLHLLFLSPERLMGTGGGGGGDYTQQMLRECNVNTFAIDEAHCISHWGHDFRPEYRQMSRLKELFPGCTVHAFTATATQHVRTDIAHQLKLEDPELLVGNFDRPNLTYRVLPRRDMFGQIREVLDRHKGEAGIIYAMRRKDVDEISKALADDKSLNRKVGGYHAGMSPDLRRRIQEHFIEEELDTIVATIAFGMGIDRSNIRFVLHVAMPKSVEAYQQETGRAGRDGLEAECVLLYSASDTISWKSLIEKSASEAGTNGTRLDPKYLPSALKHIDDMDRFARGATCRHKSLVEYFGQKYVPPALPALDGDETENTTTDIRNLKLDTRNSCAACDMCLGDTTPVEDSAVIAQKILSCIARTDQRFGSSHIISILRGENLQRIRELHHDELSTYGLLKDFAQSELRDFIYQLIGQGALDQQDLLLGNGRSVPILKLNHHSVDVMKGKRPVRLIQIVRKSTAEAGKTRGAAISWEGVDQELFDILRAWRKKLAGTRGVPPYVILPDNTLRELARVRPTTSANLYLIPGIGQAKLREFGPLLLPLIQDHSQSHHLSTDQTPGGSPGLAPARPARATHSPRTRTPPHHPPPQPPQRSRLPRFRPRHLHRRRRPQNRPRPLHHHRIPCRIHRPRKTRHHRPLGPPTPLSTSRRRRLPSPHPLPQTPLHPPRRKNPLRHPPPRPGPSSLKGCAVTSPFVFWWVILIGAELGISSIRPIGVIVRKYLPYRGSLVHLLLGVFLPLALPIAAFGQTSLADFIRSGNAKVNKGDLDGAIADYTHVIELDPTYVEAYNNRGVARKAKGDLEGAIVDYTRAIERDPKHVSAYMNRGSVFQIKGDLDEAITDYTRAIELAPNTVSAYNGRGFALAAKGDFNGSITDHTRAIVLDPKSIESYTLRGNAKQGKGDFDGAIVDYTRTIELHPADVEAYNNRGFVKKVKGDLDGAIGDYSRAIELDPRFLYAYYGLRGAYFMQRNWIKSRADFQSFCDLDSKKQDFPRLDIWILTVRLGDKDTANKDLAAFLATRTAGNDWPSTIANFLLDKLSEGDLLAAAARKEPETDADRHCEAFFYAGIKHLLANDQNVAVDYFKKCLATQRKAFVEYQLAESELKVLAR